jgi:sulfide:quinone oxidoreductase
LKRIIVIGGGIGGVEAAIALARELPDRLKYRIDLISDKTELFIFPLSIWIPVGIRKPSDLSMPIAEQRVTKIVSMENKIVTDRQAHHYDSLVIAIGSDKLRPNGIEHTLSVCGGAEESVSIRERLDALIDRGNGVIACGFSGNPLDSSAVRGGPVFEVLFNISHILQKKGVRDRFRLIFFSPSADAGNRLGGPGMRSLQKLFRQNGIETVFGRKIEEFNAEGILFEEGQLMKTDLTLFTPGMRGHAILQESDLPLTPAGFVPVNDYCQADAGVLNTDGKPVENCYVIGDCSYFEGPEWRAKQGHLAEAMARVAAGNIALREAGKTMTETFSSHMNILCVMDLGRKAVFVYRDSHRQMAPIGTWAHWAKQGWEIYYKLNKRGYLPNMPI